MKKVLFGCVLGTLLSPISLSFAGAMGEQQNNFNVYVPNLPSAYELSGGALFLRPTGINDYGVVVNPFNPDVATPILDPSWQVKGMNPNYSAGFFFDLRYVFANSGSDLNFYWAHLRTNKQRAIPPLENGNPPDFQMSGPDWEIGPDANIIRNISGQEKFDYDVFNAEVGKYVYFDPNLKTRLFTGVSGLWLKEQLASHFTGSANNLNFSSRSTSKFNGAGIRLGIDGEYSAPYNFSVVGLLAGDLFIGSQQPLTSFAGSSTLLTAAGIPLNHQHISHHSYVQVVPALDAKLGLKYAYQAGNNATLTVEGGYMASIYINAVQSYVPSTYVPDSEGMNTGSIFLQGLTKKIESFTVDGPYVMASLKM